MVSKPLGPGREPCLRVPCAKDPGLAAGFRHGYGQGKDPPEQLPVSHEQRDGKPGRIQRQQFLRTNEVPWEVVYRQPHAASGQTRFLSHKQLGREGTSEVASPALPGDHAQGQDAIGKEVGTARRRRSG